jgi:hypothetical protein
VVEVLGHQVGVAGEGPLPVGVELVAQGGERDRVEAVDPAGPHRPVGHETGVLEHLEVLRHRRARDGQAGGQLPDRLGPVGQGVEDRAARPVGERAPGICCSVSNH